MHAERVRFLAYALIAGALPLVAWRIDAWLSGPGEPGLQAAPADLRWFRDAKLGLMIHWGPASLLGTEISWSRGGLRPGEAGTGQVPPDVYDHLYQGFNPSEFNAADWVRAARQAGAQYLVFVTKHHDGFCLFHSRLTDYRITNTPFKRDVTAELADACRRAGLRFGIYYSQPDWHHPDYRTPRHERYIPYLHEQLGELCTQYGRVDLVWFDGLAWRAEDWDSPGLFRLIRGLQPGVLINDRAALPGDFSTRRLEGRLGSLDLGRDWETSLPLGEQWSWRPGDQLKSPEACIEMLVRCAGAGGNLLLNVGPMPTGAIEPRQIERLGQIGAWLGRYGESVYGTRPGPFKPAAWGVSTRRRGTVYLHILNRQRSLTLPRPTAPILSASLLTPGRVELERARDSITLRLEPARPDDPDQIVKLELACRIAGMVDREQ